MLKDLVVKVFRCFPVSFRYFLIWCFGYKVLIGVRAIVKNSKKEILLVRNRYWYKTPWSLPGGYLDKGEQPSEGCIREVFEETGCKIKNLELLVAKTPRKNLLDIIFTAELEKITKVRIDSEILEHKFFDAEDLPQNLFVEHRQLIFEEISHKIN